MAKASRRVPTMNDADLLRRFEAQRISRKLWTHRAHVRVAYLYLSQHPFKTALAKIDAGIRKLNAANNVPEGPNQGYDRTTTQAFTHLIAATMAAYGPVIKTRTSDAFCDAHPQFMTAGVLRLFYSPKRRMDPRAKFTFVAPDLAPLPKIVRRKTR